MTDWWRFNADDYSVGSPLYIEDGGWDSSVREYTVEKITPAGQIVAAYTFPNGHVLRVRVTPSGRIVGSGRWDRRRIVDPARADEIRRDVAARQTWAEIRGHAEAIDKAARNRDAAAFFEALTLLQTAALGIEAASAVLVRDLLQIVRDQNELLENIQGEIVISLRPKDQPDGGK